MLRLAKRSMFGVIAVLSPKHPSAGRRSSMAIISTFGFAWPSAKTDPKTQNSSIDKTGSLVIASIKKVVPVVEGEVFFIRLTIPNAGGDLSLKAGDVFWI